MGVRQDEVIRAVAGDAEPRRKRLVQPALSCLSGWDREWGWSGDQGSPQAEGEGVHSSGRALCFLWRSWPFCPWKASRNCSEVWKLLSLEPFQSLLPVTGRLSWLPRPLRGLPEARQRQQRALRAERSQTPGRTLQAADRPWRVSSPWRRKELWAALYLMAVSSHARSFLQPFPQGPAAWGHCQPDNGQRLESEDSGLV